MSKLSGKIAVVTGGNSGIGLATAKEFRDQGAKVAISGRNNVAEAAKQIGADVLGVTADVIKISELDNLFKTVNEKLGKVDVLFVNAGIAKVAPLADASEAHFDEIMDINFKGAYFTIQKALPYLNDNASIILNGSVNSYVGFAGLSVYSASKAALHSLARTLSAELIGRGIRVNTLNIGPVSTPLFGKVGMPQDALQGFATALTAKMPVKRFGQPEEIAKAAAFLASADSSFVVGSEISTDGGIMMNTL